MTYARVTRDYGTNADHVIFASTDPYGRMIKVHSATPYVLRRLASEGAKGLKTAQLRNREFDALVDVERKLGLYLNRSRYGGRVALSGTVAICDQRTLKEIA